MSKIMIGFGVVLLVLLVLIVIFVALAWQRISRQNSCHVYMTAVATGAALRDTGAVNIVVWAPVLLNREGDWQPSLSTVDDTLVGWVVPISGSYFVNYSTISQFDTEESVGSILIVNGQSVERSWCPSLSTLEGGPNTANLTKSFMLNLEKSDVVSLILVISSGTGISIPTDSSFAFATTLTMNLVNQSCKKNTSVDGHTDFSETGFFVGPAALSSENPITNAVENNNVVDSKTMGVDGWVSQSNLSTASSQYNQCMCLAQTSEDKLACNQRFQRQLFPSRL